MRKIIYSMFIIMLLFIWTMLLVSCDAITAQNININSAVDMNGGPRMNGGHGTNGDSRGNGNRGMNGSASNNGNFMGGIINADLMGKIISVDGNSIKIEVIEQTENSKSSNSDDGKQDVNGNQNNDNNNRQFQIDLLGSMPEMNYTGVEKTLTVNDDIDISQGPSMESQNGNDDLKSAMKVSDLKKDQIIMIWYKENTETVERISIVQS